MDLLSIKVSLVPVSITRIHYKRKAMVYICMSIIFFYGTMLMNYNNYFVFFLFTSYFWHNTENETRNNKFHYHV